MRDRRGSKQGKQPGQHVRQRVDLAQVLDFRGGVVREHGSGKLALQRCARGITVGAGRELDEENVDRAISAVG